MSIKFDKNNLLFYFSSYDFPELKINKDVLVHKDFLFSEKPTEPELLNQKNKKAKYSNYYIIETHEQRKANKAEYNKNKSQNKHYNQFNPSNQVLQDTKKQQLEDEGGNDFFDNFKGRSNNREVKDFLKDKKMFELKLSKENNIFIDIASKNSVFYEISDRQIIATEKKLQVGKVQSEKTTSQVSMSSEKFDADKLFENADLFNNSGSGTTTSTVGAGVISVASKASVSQSKTIQTQNNAYQGDLQGNIQVSTQSTSQSASQASTQSSTKASQPTPTPEDSIYNVVDISLIYKINERISYPKEKPLWYIYHEQAQSSFGPLSSLDLENMYSRKLVSGQTDVRFIDLITLKNKKPFTFFKLKDIESNIISDIEASSLIFYSSLINKKEDTSNVKPTQNQEKMQESVPKKLPNQDSIYNLPSSGSGSVSGGNINTNKHYNNYNNYNNQNNNYYNNNKNMQNYYNNKNNLYYDNNNYYQQEDQYYDEEENFNEEDYYKEKTNTGKGGKHNKWY